MTDLSSHDQVKSLEQHIISKLAAFDFDAESHAVRNLLNRLKTQLIDLRLDVRDFDYAETRAEQLRHGKAAHERVEQLDAMVLTLGEHNIFGAADIAHISAQLQALAAKLQ